MGLYIDSLPDGTGLESLNKTSQLLKAGVAKLWDDPVKAQSTVPPGMMAVVVMQNGMFDAALVMVNEEWKYRNIPELLKNDRRPHHWLLMSVEDVSKCTGVKVDDLS